MMKNSENPEKTIRNEVSYRFFRGIVKVLLVAVLVIPWGTIPSAHASATFTVDSTLDAVDAIPGDGLCATATGECTLRAAIQETNSLPGADTITLPAGTYTLTIPGADEDAAATGDLDITGDLTLTGAGQADTQINGNGGVTADRAFHIPGVATVTISGVMIGNGSADNGGAIYNAGTLTLESCRLEQNAATGGNPNGYGGGIYNTATLTISQCTLAANSATTHGGGIYNAYGDVTVSHSTLSGNSTVGEYHNGGGIYNAYGDVTVSHSALSGNSARIGGGIYNYAGTLMVRGSTLAGNTAFYGGGIRNGTSSTVIINHSTLADNSARSGGGIDNFGTLTVGHSTLAANLATTHGGGIQNSGTLTVSHSTLSANSARFGGGIFNLDQLIVSHSTLSANSARFGGGIYNYRFSSRATVTVTHSTLSANSADLDGGGVSNIQGTVRLGNSILAGNTGPSPDCRNTVNSSGYNLVGDNTGCNFISGPGDQVGTGDNPIDPLLGPLQDNGGPTFTHALLTGSPAIDMGTHDDCPPTDQRGVARPMDGDGNGIAICDIGAYELEEAQ